MRGRILALGLIAIGCASELVTSARTDQLPTFKQKLEAAQQAKPTKLDAAQVRDVAVAVASRELVTARQPEAEARVVEVADCAEPLSEALGTLSERRDSVGALAIQVLIDARHLDDQLDDLSERYRAAEQDDWRAVGMRASVQPASSSLRVAGFLDPDLRVRRAALRASRDARAVADLPALFEAARLDPDRVSRKFALEALATVVDAAYVARLRELWAAADEEERLEIVNVWASARGFSVGGQQQLAWVLSTDKGKAALAAAAALLEQRAEPVAAWAEETLAAAIGGGPVEESRFALQVAPRRPKVNLAIQKAMLDGDEARAVGAAIVASKSNESAPAAIKRLKELRESANVEVATPASLALAAIGDPKAVAWLDAQLSAKNPESRLAAGVSRFADGTDANAAAKAASLLADSDASVRVRFACWALRDRRPSIDYFHSQLQP